MINLGEKGLTFSAAKLSRVLTTGTASLTEREVLVHLVFWDLFHISFHSEDLVIVTIVVSLYVYTEILAFVVCTAFEKRTAC